MLDNILGLVKQEVSDAVVNNADVPEDKKDEAVHATTSAIMNELKNSLTPENLSSLLGMFGNRPASAGTGSNVVNNVQNSVVSALADKVGINKGTAINIAAAVIPAIMSIFSKKVNDPGEPSFNINSIIGAFTGNSNDGIIGAIGKLFAR